MVMVIGGSGTIAGLSVGGLPAGSVNTASLAASSVTQVKVADAVVGTGPAFYAYGSSNITINNTTDTKIPLTATVFNTAGFDTTNQWFKPSVAGYYFFSGAAFTSTGYTTRHQVEIFKNGAAVLYSAGPGTSSLGGANIIVTGLLYANGTTDYFELYYYQNSGGSTTLNASNVLTWFQGFLARAA